MNIKSIIQKISLFIWILEAYTDLDHANYLIAGLLILVMIVLAIWIKFFLSWKKELDSTFHSSDNAPINNHDPDEENVEKDEQYKETSSNDKNEMTVEGQEHRPRLDTNQKSQKHQSYIDNVNVVMLNRSWS